MDTTVEVGYDLAGMMFGPDALLPWWAWLAPLAMVFLKLLGPVFIPEVADARWASEQGGTKGRKAKKASKKKK